MENKVSKHNDEKEWGSRYNPKGYEDKWYKYWLEGGYFRSEVDEGKKPYVTVMPPPNITSRLHMGHGLNNTIQDILIRWKKMSGYNALWIPGTDHAGIATQNVVEKALRSEGKSRHDYSRSEFINRVWEWREEYGNVIIEQLKKLGCACDWERCRFSMDEGLSNAVQEVFIRLYEEGLIYKGKYIVNWCPRCTTALSTEEVEHKELDGYFYHIKYKLAGDERRYLRVATTRPETLLGDTGVAVNPKDERYRDLIGKKVLLPLQNREIPIVGDEYARLDFGSGVVKITPAHDPNDFQVGKRHGLAQVNVMRADGKMNEEAGERYVGLDRFECRKRLVEDLKAGGLLLEVEEYKHSVGHCYRCQTVIEPYLSDQWFVKMQVLATKALDASEKGMVEFYPSKWSKVYKHWLKNIEDWCISRQIWWGHRVPVWKCMSCGNIIVSREEVKECKCGSRELKQDEDVLDTWFSSWLWPFSTLGWPSEDEDVLKDIKYYYPTDVLSTAPEILFFWVARMIMSGLHFVGEVPFSKVYLHSTVLDKYGRKMSKSLGNGIDPLDVIEEHGADALRFTLVSLAPIGQNIRVGFDKKQNDFLKGSRFANKLWNASNYILSNLKDNFTTSLIETHLTLIDKWILTKLQGTIDRVVRKLEEFQFNDVSYSLYDFVWHDFCDWYIEFSKVDLYKESKSTSSEERKEAINSVLLYVLGTVLKLLHPLMPFITEEIWHRLPGIVSLPLEKQSILKAQYPIANKEFIYPESEYGVGLLKDIIYTIRNIRGELNISSGLPLEVIIRSKDKKVISLINKHEYYILNLARLKSISIVGEYKLDINTANAILQPELEVYVPLVGGVIDIKKEKSRIEKAIVRVQEDMSRSKKRLDNESFLKKAQDEVVAKEQAKLLEAQQKLNKLNKNLAFFVN